MIMSRRLVHQLTGAELGMSIINWIKTGNASLNRPLDDYDRERQLFHWISLAVMLIAVSIVIFALMK